MTITYRCTISDDGYADVDLPISSAQLRLRQSPLQCYISVQVPGVLDYADEITDRQDGEIALYRIVDGVETEVLTANISAVRMRLGPRSKSGEIVGYKQITFPGTGAHTLADLQYRSVDGSSFRYRAPPDPAIKPEDEMTVPSWEVVAVGEIGWTVGVGAGAETMEIEGSI